MASDYGNTVIDVEIDECRKYTEILFHLDCVNSIADATHT